MSEVTEIKKLIYKLDETRRVCESLRARINTHVKDDDMNKSLRRISGRLYTSFLEARGLSKKIDDLIIFKE